MKTKRLHPYFSAQALSAYVITIVLVSIGMLFTLRDNPNASIPYAHREENAAMFHSIVEHATRFIAPWALSKWSESEYLIVFGIPSEDSPPRQRRRDLQREHCWSYDGVAALRNQYSGVMPVLYVMGRSPLHQFKYSTALENEARAWQDVLTLPIDEGRKSTKKQIGFAGFWGTEAEIGMSRKTFLWFYLSRQLFPKASYVAKGDDDAFIRVPAYLGTLRLLPRTNIYWGYIDWRKASEFGAVTRGNSKFLFATGFCMTLAKDMVEKFISHKPLQRMIFVPYNESIIKEFNAVAMQHEDVMVGAALHNIAYPNIVYVKEPPCRIHNVLAGTPIRPVTSNSMAIHHIREPEYRRLKEMFQNKSTLNNLITHRNEFEIQIQCRSRASLASLII